MVLLLKIMALVWGTSLVVVLWLMWAAPLCDENQQPIEKDR